MLTVHHGGIPPSEEHALPNALPKFPFGYMFPDLQHDEYLLPEADTTVSDLRYIGTEAMSDPATQIAGVEQNFSFSHVDTPSVVEREFPGSVRIWVC